MIKNSLHKQKNDLAQSKTQLDILSGKLFKSGELPTFKTTLENENLYPLKAKALEILQINLGYMCNQVCAHCHVDAGPDRKEIMSKATMLQCLEIIKSTNIHTLDLTGGAPEMNPNFKWFVTEAYQAGISDFIVRSNLTIIKANKKYYDLPDFFKTHQIHIISSLPHWTQSKTDKQRGAGAFNKSIEALKALNSIGYGMPNSPLKLDLVYNPSGAFLPASQTALEKDFKQVLLKDFGIQFHQLFALTNLPISRFLDYLIASDNYEDYMHTLVDAFNPATVKSVMCTNTLSVSWNGFLYDCDFNQMLELPINHKPTHISAFNKTLLKHRDIVISQHCYGCTAGAGSSCQGHLI